MPNKELHMDKMLYMCKNRLVAEYIFDVAKNRVYISQIGHELMDQSLLEFCRGLL